jgi:glycosyltransferase involved in cell wall biosynthesis
MQKIIISILAFIQFLYIKNVLGGGPEDEILGFGIDRSLFILRGSENSSFARSQPSIELRDLGLENDVFPINDELSPASTMPVVLVAIPTFNRVEFLLQSLEYVRRQQYPRERLRVAILDDSQESLEDNDAFLDKIDALNEVGIKVYYKHRIIVPSVGQENIGQKRNAIVRWIKKDLMENEKDVIIIHWDDDDWQAPHRIMKQVLPLVTGQSEMTALDLRTILILHENQVFARYAADGRRYPLERMSINGGTLCYWASIWNENAKFPNLGCGEDIMFVDRTVTQKRRVTLLDDSDVSVIYLRHMGNTWGGLDPSSWILVPDKNLPPRFLKDAYFYREMQNWKKPKWSGKFQRDEESWWCSSNVDQIKTVVVNEIRGL